MILTRKLIFPALIVFAALLAGIFAYSYLNLHNTYHEAEEADLVSYRDAFVAEIENQKNVALTLAAAAASSPEIQRAVAERDRQRLIELTLPNFEALKTYNVTQYQYYLPDGERFLSLNDIHDQNAAQTLSVVLLANSEQRPVAGLETENGMLGVRGVVPIHYQGNHIGSVEFGIGFNDTLLDNLKKKYGGEWHILLSEDFFVEKPSQQLPTETTPLPELGLYATTQSRPLYNATSSYTLALQGENSITHPSVGGRDYAILTAPLRNFSERIVGTLDIVYDHTHVSHTQNRRLLFAGLVSILALVLGSASLVVLTTRLLRPIQTLTNTAAAIAEGNSTRPIDTKPGEDEIATLTAVFNKMTMQLRNSITDLETRVADRTHDLEHQTKWLRLAAEVVRDAAYARNLEDLLDRSTALILERFKFYHTGIFLLDNTNEHAVLVASPTEAGKQLISNHYRVRVGEVGIVGHVSASGEAQSILNRGIDAVHFNNPFLPNTRSELALPLKLEARIIGVLDVHSNQPRAFTTEEIAIIQIMADQLASAIERTRLLQTVEKSLSELESAYGRYTLESWKGLVDGVQRGSKGYRFDNIRIQSMSELPELGKQALNIGKTVNANGNYPKSEKQNSVAIPIKLRGQTIGVVTVKLKDSHRADTISTIEAATERLALAMESARLYEEARLRADREQSISRITTAISTPTEYEEILQTTVREIGKMLNDTDVAIQIVGDLSRNEQDE